MRERLIQEFGCDHPHCLKKARIETGSMSYGTNYSKECSDLEKRGWSIYGFKHYCKAHKSLHNWGTMMTDVVLEKGKL